MIKNYSRTYYINDVLIFFLVDMKASWNWYNGYRLQALKYQ